MKKTGWVKLDKTKSKESVRACQSCKGIATQKVTFEDDFGKLIVSLCGKCAKKDYSALMLQGRFSWPVKT